MSTVHDNGRRGNQPDLFAMIDQLGALVAAVNALEADARAAGEELDGIEWGASTRLLLIAGDARDASVYLARALRAARGLV